MDNAIGVLIAAEEKTGIAVLFAPWQEVVVGALSFAVLFALHGAPDLALTQLSEKDVVHLDDERRATMVSNLMVVLCGERETQPVVNAGSLY